MAVKALRLSPLLLPARTFRGLCRHAEFSSRHSPGSCAQKTIRFRSFRAGRGDAALPGARSPRRFAPRRPAPGSTIWPFQGQVPLMRCRKSCRRNGAPENQSLRLRRRSSIPRCQGEGEGEPAQDRRPGAQANRVGERAEGPSVCLSRRHHRTGVQRLAAPAFQDALLESGRQRFLHQAWLRM